MTRFPILVVAVFAFFFPALAQKGEILWSQSTDWGQVLVRQRGAERVLLFGDPEGETEESRMDTRRPHRPVLRYLQQMLAATAMWEAQAEGREQAELDLLVVGLGGASLSNALSHLFPKATVVSVEIEPAVVEAARRYFFFQENDRSRVVIDDARRFLETTDQRFDVIYLDAFDGVEVPEGLRTVEFTRLLESRLRPGGAVIANIHLVPETSSQRYQKALTEALPQRRMFQGLAQSTGIFTRQRLETGGLGAPISERYSLPLYNLLEEAPPTPLQGVEPFRDGQP